MNATEQFLTDVKSIAVVLPRYGSELGGGAETLTRSLILAIRDHDKKHNVDRKIEVWTTCAKDHRTWDNFYKEEVVSEDGFTVRRFRVDERDLEVFINSEHAIAAAKPLTVDEQLNWLASGVNSLSLYQHIVEHGKNFDCLLFAPYLFSTTFWGSLIYPEKSVIIPCLHNEAYAYLDVFRVLFQKVRGLIFNANAEQELAAQLYGAASINDKGAVVGMGFVPPAIPTKNSSEYAGTKYVLYSGRKEQGKNLDLIINWFEKLKSDIPELKLLLIGSGEINFRKDLPIGVEDLGFVSAEDKYLLMRDALVLCQPSVNESFSIVLMEAWQLGTPVIVHTQCAVTREHVVNSNGGLHFKNYEEFASAIKYLYENPELAKQMGQEGKSYVESMYSWDAVLNRLDLSFKKFNYGS